MDNNSILQYNQVINHVIAKYASRLIPEDKEDLKQEAYLALLKAGDKVTGPGFAFKVARNRILNVLRDNVKYGKISFFEDKIVVETPIPDFDIDVIYQALSGLSIQDSFIIRAFYGIESVKLNEREIAEFLRKSKTWVQKRKRKIIQRLREKYAYNSGNQSDSQV